MVFLRRIWKAYSIDKILQPQRGVFPVRFSDEESKETVLRLNNLPFDRKPLVVVPWTKNMELRGDIQKVPVWVQFPYLPLKFWGTENLCRLARQLGYPQEIDILTMQKDRAQFARMQILMEIKEELVESVNYLDEEGRVRVQRVHYEWQPVVCKNCKGYGHLLSECRKSKKQISVPKVQSTDPPPAPVQSAEPPSC